MIGYVNQLSDYFNGAKPKKAQSIPASLFYRKDENMGIEGMPFDLFISEKHKLSYKIGDHPLQNGVTISDHVKKELREVTIEGMFTNHPVKPLSEVDAVTFKDDFATKEEKSSMSNTAMAKFSKLKALADYKEPVRIVCSLEVYPKMVITDIDYDRDSKSGSSIKFSMTLREVITVDLKSTKKSIAFTPASMSVDRDKMIADMKKSGKTNAQIKEAAEMAELENVKLVSAGL